MRNTVSWGSLKIKVRIQTLIIRTVIRMGTLSESSMASSCKTSVSFSNLGYLTLIISIYDLVATKSVYLGMAKASAIFTRLALYPM